MPIVQQGDIVQIEYTMPEDIDHRIPEYFYFAMAGELCSIFGIGIFDKVDAKPDYEGYYWLDAGTSGWVEAFTMTCKKLNMEWLLEYWQALEWYDADLFDGIIEDRIVRHFIECEDMTCNAYYKYLVSGGRI